MHRICLDPGHGGRDPGTVRGGLEEKAVTLEIALAAREVLRRRYRVMLTRDGDITLPLTARRLIAERARADLFVSIHVNAARRPRASGYEVLVRPGAEALSWALASAILVQFARHWPNRRNRGLRQAAMTVLRQKRPACLVECFFLSNPAERGLLSNPKVRADLGEAIAWGCGNLVASMLTPAAV